MWGCGRVCLWLTKLLMSKGLKTKIKLDGLGRKKLGVVQGVDALYVWGKACCSGGDCTWVVIL